MQKFLPIWVHQLRYMHMHQSVVGPNFMHQSILGPNLLAINHPWYKYRLEYYISNIAL